MKKRLTILFTILFGVLTAFAQFDYQWATTAGGSSADFGDGVAVDGAGNTFIAGTFRNSMNLLGEELVPESTQNTMFLAKITRNQQVSWVVTAEADGNTGAGGFKTQYHNGFVYVMGDLRGDATFFSADFTETSLSSDTRALFIAKYTENGMLEWARKLESSHAGGIIPIGSANNFVVDDQGAVYLTTQFRTDVDIAGTLVDPEGSGGTNMHALLVKFDALGAYQWHWNSTHEGDDRGEGLALNPEGNLVFAVRYNSMLTVGSATYTNENGGIVLIEVTPAGALVWDHNIYTDNTNRAFLWDIEFDSAGNMYLAGASRTTLTWDVNNVFEPESTTRTNAFVFKVSPTGQLVWTRFFGDIDENTNAKAIKVGSTGDLIVAGETIGEMVLNDNITITSAGGFDIFHVVMDPDTGDFIAGGGFGGESNELFGMMAVSQLGDLYFIGRFLNDFDIDEDSFASEGSFDIFFVRMMYTPLIPEAEILAFYLEEQTDNAVIDQEEGTIDIEVVFGTDITALSPSITASLNATVDPASGEEVNFTDPVTYTVTALGGLDTKEYTVTVSMAQNSEAEILSFSLPELMSDSMIDSEGATVWAEVVFGTDVTSLSPSITVSEGATIDPESGEETDFSDPVEYTVTAEDGTIKTWSVSVTVAANTAADILMFELDEQTGPAEIDMDEQEIHIEVEFGTDVTALSPSITISDNATIDPMSGVPQDFTEPVVYTVTAEDLATMKEWTVFVTVADDPVVPYPIPFAEDFTGVEVGTIPADWARTHDNWGVTETNNAGGEAPEMRLNWSPSTTDQVRLHTPLLDATEVDFDLSLAFNHMIDWYSESFDLMVQITTDGEEWTDLWSITVTGDLAATTEVVDLNAYTGQQFVLAFVFDGETTFDINQWYIDDVFVGEYIAPETFTLSLVADPAEGGTVSGAGEYEAGEEVAVAAVSNDGFDFVNWTLGGDVVSTDAAFTYTMPAADVTLTANFEVVVPDTYTLTLEADPAEGGTVAGAGEYEEGTVVTVTATPADNYVFLSWTDATGNELSTDASFDYTMPAADVTLIAQFDIEDFVQELDGTMINLFPNPAREVFTITAGTMINAVIITDITGKVVFNDVVNNTEVRIENQFETGIYIIHIHTEEGVSMRKLQIQK